MSGTGVEKALKLINRDKVNVIYGDVNSAIAYAMSQVTSEHKIYQIVPGGHTDPITGVRRANGTCSASATRPAWTPMPSPGN